MDIARAFLLICLAAGSAGAAELTNFTDVYNRASKLMTEKKYQEALGVLNGAQLRDAPRRIRWSETTSS